MNAALKKPPVRASVPAKVAFSCSWILDPERPRLSAVEYLSLETPSQEAALQRLREQYPLWTRFAISRIDWY